LRVIGVGGSEFVVETLESGDMTGTSGDEGAGAGAIEVVKGVGVERGSVGSRRAEETRSGRETSMESMTLIWVPIRDPIDDECDAREWER